VAQAFWCSLESKGAKFEPARFPIISKPTSIAWFDLLLEGGIHLPNTDGKPLLILITGPPGTGKTTLAMELSYRITRSVNHEDGGQRYALFFSTDSETNRVIESARSFGFEGASEHILPFRNRAPDVASLTVCGREHFEKWTSSESFLDGLTEALQVGLSWIFSTTEPIAKLKRPMKQPLPPGTTDALAVVALDNLNNVPPEKQERFLRRIVEAVPQARLLICVAEDHPAQTSHPWEFAADIWVRLRSIIVQDYHLRTIEIVKSRYQSAVSGAHQLKIYPKQSIPLSDDVNNAGTMRRGHPYRTEGGIFIFPSIHYHLSRYKRRGPIEEAEPSGTRIEALDKMLDGGLPRGRCTAFIGDRGGHKSHLGYLHLLHRIVEDAESGVVISLRDDEQLTRRAMARIMKQEFRQFSTFDDNALDVQLDYWEQKDQLEILYFHPGYITPNEFFHRVFMSIYRMKCRHNGALTTLFNSIDQLAARFPLCAKEEIFVPGMIESFSGEGVTGIFIAVDEGGQPLEQYGLLPMADLILGFRRQKFSFQEYYEHLDRQRKLSTATGKFKVRFDTVKESNRDKNIEEVVLQVMRFGGGQRAGKRGILELVDAPENTLYTKAGLHFTEMA
jgi:KaiC/GvpD/RAD55 family RecA-like ATPase